MADDITLGLGIPIKAIDNGDGTYSLSINLSNSVTIDDATPVDVNVVTQQTTAYKVVLSAGVTSDIKLTPGYVYAINTALTDLQVLNDSVVVWEGNYSAGYPFYNSSSIKLSSATGGTAYIVVK